MLTGFLYTIRLGLHFICLQKTEMESNTLTYLLCYLFVYKNFWKSQNDFMFCNTVYDPR